MLQGLIKPHECAAFGKECTPRNPLGATMVSVRGRLRGVLPLPAAASSPPTVGTPWLRRPLTVTGRTERCDFEGWTCPVPLRDTPTIVMGHGGGGAMSAELVEHLFLPAFGDAAARAAWATPRCSTLGRRHGWRSRPTRSWCEPMFFPGGSIGDLAVNGTVNDLAMSGARPLFLSAAFILEEGTALADVGPVAAAPRRGGRARAGVRVVTGDTKVVDAGHGDGVYVNTAGIGVVPDGVDIRPDRARPGDVVIVSGTSACTASRS